MQEKKIVEKKYNLFQNDQKIENSVNKNLLKQTLFTVAYYNALGYYPTSFFIWKNLIDPSSSGKAISFMEVFRLIDILINRKKIVIKNGMYKINNYPIIEDSQENNKNYKAQKNNWYKIQIQKNKISIDKIKRAKKFARASRWVPYLRGILLTGTLAMKRGGSDSDWDVMIVLRKNRIWLGRLIVGGWLHSIGKRRYGKKINNRFCLNQFVVDKKLKFTEHNEFFSNELITAENLIGDETLYNKIINKNKEWLKLIKPNFKMEQFIQKEENNKINNLLKFIQIKIENILETLRLAKLLNNIAKKIMIYKIINNSKTYEAGADIRYSDFFLVFLPRPQREVIRSRAFKLLTRINL